MNYTVIVELIIPLNTYIFIIVVSEIENANCHLLQYSRWDWDEGWVREALFEIFEMLL